MFLNPDDSLDNYGAIIELSKQHPSLSNWIRGSPEYFRIAVVSNQPHLIKEDMTAETVDAGRQTTVIIAREGDDTCRRRKTEVSRLLGQGEKPMSVGEIGVLKPGVLRKIVETCGQFTVGDLPLEVHVCEPQYKTKRDNNAASTGASRAGPWWAPRQG